MTAKTASRRKKPTRKSNPSRSKTRSHPRSTRASKGLRAAKAGPAQVLDILFRDEITPNRYDDSAATGRARARKGGLLMRQVHGWRVADPYSVCWSR